MARDDDEKKSGAPEWIITFADMMSLLLVFFVFILTFSTLEIQKYQKVAGSLQAALGIIPRDKLPLSLPSFINADEPRPRKVENGPETPSEIDRSSPDDDVEAAMRKELEDDRVMDMDSYPNGLRIRPGAGIFDPSSERLPRRWRGMILDVADVLRPYDHRVLVRAFTDDQFLATSDHPDPKSLRVARALEVAAILEEGGLDSDRIGIRLDGTEAYPYPNDTPRNRSKNRSFEILVLNERERE